jgi:hypothetical protein
MVCKARMRFQIIFPLEHGVVVFGAKYGGFFIRCHQVAHQQRPFCSCSQDVKHRNTFLGNISLLVTMIVTRVLTLVLLAFLGPCCVAQTSLPMDSVIMQLRSQSDSNSPDLLGDFIQVTTTFLNEYFAAYFNGMQPNTFFENVELVANTFGVQGDNGSFFLTVEFDGELIFNDAQAAESMSNLFTDMMINAFKGHNIDLYLEDLLTMEDPFFRDLTRVIVEINDEFVSDTNPDDSIHGSNNTSEKPWDLSNWVEVTIYAAAGACGAILVCGMIFLFRCLQGGRGQIRDEDEAMIIKKIEFKPQLAADDRQSSHPPKSTTNSKATTKRQGLETRTRQDLARARPTPPSPTGSLVSRSIVSQDSSLFTYNMSRDAGTLSLGSLSMLHTENGKHFDLEAWQNPTVISSKVPAPFGHDISAIEKRDHMSMMEGDDSMLRLRGSAKPLNTRNPSKNEPFHHHNAGNNTGRSSTRPYPYSSSAARYTTTIPEGNSHESSAEISMSSSSDVISDLKNLSMQIDQHRRSQRS